MENYPCEVLAIFDLVVTEIYKEHCQGADANSDYVIIQVRPFNMRSTFKIRDLDANRIESLVTIKGIVIRCSDIIPEMQQAFFKCFKCHFEHMAPIEKGKIEEPDTCEQC